MAAGTLTETLDNLYTSTWQNMKDTLADQIFDALPFWYWLKDKGKMETVEGGRFITEPLQFDKTDSVKWIGRGGTASMNDFQFMTVAKYDWRYLVGSITRFGIDDQQNRGKNQIINLMNSKMDNVKNGLISEFESRLFGAAGSIVAGTTTAENPAIDGLQWLVADDPTSGSNTVGGIDPSANTWWQNKRTNATGKSFATYGISLMRTLLNNTANNLRQDTPDIILSGQTPYEYYEDTVLPVYRVSNNKLGDMGFQNIQFKGIPMIWSPSCASTRMYMLNTNYIKYIYDPMMFLDMTSWKDIPNQVNDRVSQIITACAFTISRRRCQGVLFNIDTP
jgi:hypothetical protein